jgi:hypothetical protein
MDEERKKRRLGQPYTNGDEDAARPRFPAPPRRFIARFLHPEPKRDPDIFLEAWLRSRRAS